MKNKKSFQHLVFEDAEIEKIQQVLRESIDLTDENLFGDEETCDPGERHDPSEVMQRNAEFLLESSKKVAGYNEQILFLMQRALDLGNYSEVIDLAYQHDRERRQNSTRSVFVPAGSRLERVKQFVANILTLLSN
jgi:hypothetical protein